MESLIQQYLRILDIDPSGYYLRLINKSNNHSLDLSNIQIQQRTTKIPPINELHFNPILKSYKFDNQIQRLLPSGEFVTVYSYEYRRVQCEMEPNIFIADSVSRWSTSNHIQTELSLNQNVFDRSRTFLPSDNDIPYLYVHSIFPLKQSLKRVKTALPTRETTFHFPYCLSDNNIVNPYTTAMPSRKMTEWKSSWCRPATPLVKDFDTYARRLTTSPKRIQSSRNRMT